MSVADRLLRKRSPQHFLLGTAPLGNSWIIFIVQLYLALSMTPNTLLEGGGSIRTSSLFRVEAGVGFVRLRPKVLRLRILAWHMNYSLHSLKGVR